MARGGVRDGAGRKSAFPHKVLDQPFGMDFTPDGHRALRQLQAKTGLSQSDVLAHLVERHASMLTFTMEGVAFPGKLAENILRIRLPEHLGDALRAAQTRTGKSFSDLGEALVRWYGDAETFPVLQGKAPQKRRRGRKSARRRRRA